MRENVWLGVRVPVRVCVRDRDGVWLRVGVCDGDVDCEAETDWEGLWEGVGVGEEDADCEDVCVREGDSVGDCVREPVWEGLCEGVPLCVTSCDGVDDILGEPEELDVEDGLRVEERDRVADWVGLRVPDVVREAVIVGDWDGDGR